jgi:hypothetical protein
MPTRFCLLTNGTQLQPPLAHSRGTGWLQMEQTTQHAEHTASATDPAVCLPLVYPADRIRIPGQFMWDLWWTEWPWEGFSPCTSGFPCHHSTSAPYSLTHLPPTLPNIVSLQRPQITRFRKLRVAVTDFSSVSTVTNLEFKQPKTRASIPERAKIFVSPQLPGRLQRLRPIHCGLVWCEAAGHFYIIPKLRMCGYIPPLPPTPTWKDKTPVPQYLFGQKHRISPTTKSGFLVDRVQTG